MQTHPWSGFGGERCSADDEDKGGDERTERGNRCSDESPGQSALDVVPGEEADEGVDHDERPRCGFSEGKTRDHVVWGKPAVVVDRRIGDEGKDCIGPAEGD